MKLNMREPKDVIIKGKTLEQILTDHLHWLNRDCDGWENMFADLYNTDLSYVDLSHVDLSYADLGNADLHCANLYDANLRGANLRGADLRGADSYIANLYGANLYGADLRGADLYVANLYCADLRDANLRDANLYGANLYDTNLYGAKGKLIEWRRGKVLTEDIIGYKKCKHGVIVKLLIPRGAIVFSINGDKCRTNKAKVISIDGADRAYSDYNNMSYYVGDEFTIYNFNCQSNVECAEGIHFFMTKEEVKNCCY